MDRLWGIKDVARYLDVPVQTNLFTVVGRSGLQP